MFQSLVVDYCIHWLLDALAAQTATVNWAQVQAQIQAKINAFVSNAWLASEAGKGVHLILDAVMIVLQDQADLDTVLTDLAAKNWTGAEVALKAALAKMLPPDLAALLTPVATPASATPSA